MGNSGKAFHNSTFNQMSIHRTLYLFFGYHYSTLGDTFSCKYFNGDCFTPIDARGGGECRKISTRKTTLSGEHGCILQCDALATLLSAALQGVFTGARS